MTLLEHGPEQGGLLSRSPLVDEDFDRHRFRIHRDTMTSPIVLAEEMARIFDRCWLYVGHESEVRNPGDYVRRPVGGRPVFMVRGARSGQVHVFHNTCPHRGAVVCRHKSGNSKVFQCFYHAWSFDSEGALVGVPGREAYGSRLDFDALGLRPVARMESYRGFVFACFDPGVPDLVSYLAGAREHLDLIVDSADGAMEVVKGTNEYGIDANWKLLAENSLDGYHAVPTHDTYLKYLVGLGTDVSGGVTGVGLGLGNGHAVIEYTAPMGRPIAKWAPQFGEQAREDIAQLRVELVARYGEQRAARMADYNRNLLIYPNLVINDVMAVTVRTFMPLAPDRMDVTAWQLAPGDEEPQLRKRRLDAFVSFFGPAGLATPDDSEALESCQLGYTSGGVEWNDLSRGMTRETNTSIDEEHLRAFWRQWADQMGAGGREESR
jgi:p-cumate 2,3-dioxygenase alpha subunit